MFTNSRRVVDYKTIGGNGSRLAIMDMASCLMAGSMDLSISEMFYGFVAVESLVCLAATYCFLISFLLGTINNDLNIIKYYLCLF